MILVIFDFSYFSDEVQNETAPVKCAVEEYFVLGSFHNLWQMRRGGHKSAPQHVLLFQDRRQLRGKIDVVDNPKFEFEF